MLGKGGRNLKPETNNGSSQTELAVWPGWATMNLWCAKWCQETGSSVHRGGEGPGHRVGPLKCHREKFAVRRCLAAGLANWQLKSSHFIFWGRTHSSKFEGRDLGGWHVLRVKGDLWSPLALPVCTHGLTVASAFAAVPGAASVCRLAFGTAGSWRVVFFWQGDVLKFCNLWCL